MTNEVKRTFDALPDEKDTRDYKVSLFFEKTKLSVPEFLDLSKTMGPVRDQKNLGACVGFASTEIKTYQEVLDIKRPIVFSPLFIYWQRDNCGEGMYPRTAMKIMNDYGACFESTLPYSKMASRGQIPQAAFKEAEGFRISSYARVENLDDLKQALFEDGPVMITIPIYESFHSTNSSGVVPDPKESENVLGYHAVVAVGYDDARKHVKIKNSWGEYWGNKGYGYLSYDFITKNMKDAWTCVDYPSKKIHWWEWTWMTIRSWFNRNPLLFSFVVMLSISIVYVILKRP